MSRKFSLDTKRLAAEGQSQALKHAKDAVDRSSWLLAMLRKELAEEPGARGLRRLELYCVLSDLERRQSGLSAAYDSMAALPPLRKNRALKSFILAYDEFLSAVGAARMDSRNDGALCPANKQPANEVRPGCSLPAVAGN